MNFSKLAPTSQNSENTSAFGLTAKEIRILFSAFLQKESFIQKIQKVHFSKSTQLSITDFRLTKDPLDLKIQK